MKSLIVTADDFGVSPAVNEAVIRAFRDGILRYASLMVNRRAAGEAARLAKEAPGLGVGLHLELCRGNPARWGLRYFFSRVHRKRIEARIVSQIEKFLSFGLKPTHVDGHCNIHVHPVIFPILARLARRYGIARIRLPLGEAPLSRRFSREELFSREALAGVFGILGAYLRPRGEGLLIPERTFGLLRSGAMSEDYWLWLIRNLPDGLAEIYCHPSSGGDGRPTPGHHSIGDLKVLLSPRVREALLEAGVTLAEEPQGFFSSVPTRT